MREQDLIQRYPYLYHLAFGPAVWPSIGENGLQSASSLLATWEVPEARRKRLVQTHRGETVILRHRELGVAYLRDQHPMNAKMLQRALTDMTVAEWIEQLNSYVFFSPTIERLESLYKAYASRPRLVLTLQTESVVRSLKDQVWLSPINTGAVRHIDHKRGSDTLAPLPAYSHKNVAEVAIKGVLPDVRTHLVALDVWSPDGLRSPLSA